MLTIQQQKRVKDDCGNDAGCANRWIANFKTSNGLRDVKREQQIKQNRQDSLDAVYKNSGPVKKAWMVLAESNQNVVFVMTGQNQILKQDYLKSCKAEFSTENTDFYDAWTSQRQTGTISREWSLATYNRFIRANAPQQLNIPAPIFDKANYEVAQPVDAKGNGGYVSLFLTPNSNLHKVTVFYYSIMASKKVDVLVTLNVLNKFT